MSMTRVLHLTMASQHNVLWVIDLPSVSTLSGQSVDLSGGLWFPLAFRQPALASEGIPSPLRVPAFVAVGLLRPPQTASGLPCSASVRRGGGGCPLYSEGRVSLPARYLPRGPWALRG